MEVTTLGESEREVKIIVNPDIVRNYGLTNKDVLASIAKSNLMIPAGTLSNEKGSFNLKIPSLIENREDLLNIPIKSTTDAVVTLDDVAEIRDSFKDKLGFARNNGQNAIILEISKRTGENIIETINKIKDLIKNEKEVLPKALNIGIFQDESEKIKTQIKDLENNVIPVSYTHLTLPTMDHV